MEKLFINIWRVKVYIRLNKKMVLKINNNVINKSNSVVIKRTFDEYANYIQYLVGKMNWLRIIKKTDLQ